MTGWALKAKAWNDVDAPPSYLTNALPRLVRQLDARTVFPTADAAFQAFWYRVQFEPRLRLYDPVLVPVYELVPGDWRESP